MKLKLTKKFWHDKKVLITGSSGFLGQHLTKIISDLDPKEVSLPTHNEYDLTDQTACDKVCKGQDIVIHLAAEVGGIGYNLEHPGELFYKNLLMDTHLIEQARLAKVKKFVGIGTICAYPKFTPIPFKEENLWAGYPEETNAPYGLAKKMMLVQLQAYKQQYNFNGIYLLPVNLYGPGDNFNEESSHVVPALIKKIFAAKQNREREVIIWGTGLPTREFLFVRDAATAIALATQHYNKPDPINIGSSFEISIRELAETICKMIGFNGKLVFDSSKPDGQPRRKLDVTKAEAEFGFKSQTTFMEGLQETIDWYQKNYQKIK